VAAGQHSAPSHNDDVYIRAIKMVVWLAESDAIQAWLHRSGECQLRTAPLPRCGQKEHLILPVIAGRQGLSLTAATVTLNGQGVKDILVA